MITILEWDKRGHLIKKREYVKKSSASRALTHIKLKLDHFLMPVCSVK